MLELAHHKEFVSSRCAHSSVNYFSNTILLTKNLTILTGNYLCAISGLVENCFNIFSMRDLLNKFRIDYSSLTMVQGIGEKPTQQSIEFFTSLVQTMKINES